MKQVKATRYYRVDREHPAPDVIEAAARVIRGGGTVAFPTETVYGLGANGLDPEAVEKIFRAKGRPRGNPLILHVSSLDQARGLVAAWPPEAETLARLFLPGPLTLILPRAPVVPDVVTAGLPSVALRYPAHPVALALIEASGVPIAAPSANLSGHPSPTCAAHVRSDLDGRIDVILDGGPTEVGLESTILSLTGDRPVLLRPGGVTREQIEKALGVEVKLHEAVLTGRPRPENPEKGAGSEATAVAPCPGLFFKHYAPRARVIMVTGDPDRQAAKIGDYLNSHQDLRIGVLATEENAVSYRESTIPPAHLEILGSRRNPPEIASRFFGALRNCDDHEVDIILVETIPAAGIGLAVMNRLCRAAENRAI
ncbi:MAG TPA: threonylcarbamoyl-AMP synthase [Syntrophomonadaceae bacterium]|nr:threonylcarbamoyl-AMP synthase [Syntrophomonadaceae bacterium]